MAENTDKVHLTVSSETLEWLKETYPDALSEQEAVRMAISDARNVRQREEHSDTSDNME